MSTSTSCPPAVDSDPSAESEPLVEWVTADPFRALLRHLLDQTQLTLYELATLLELPWPACRALAVGRPGRPPARRIHPGIARALLGTTAASLRAGLERSFRATTTVARARELEARGHTAEEIGRRTGIGAQLATELLAGDVATCTGRTRMAIATMVIWSESRPAVSPRTTGPADRPAEVRGAPAVRAA